MTRTSCQQGRFCHMSVDFWPDVRGHSISRVSRFLNRVTISGHIRNSVKKKEDIFPLVLLWFWSFLIIFWSHILRCLTSNGKISESNEPIFDRLDIFSDAMNLKNTLVLLFRDHLTPIIDSGRPQGPGIPASQEFLLVYKLDLFL